jgi:hypothetical protein
LAFPSRFSADHRVANRTARHHEQLGACSDALAAAFKAGVVTNLPPASGDVFALLGRIG